jgi:RNA polymerase sigma factor (sigma-70 family)
MQEGRLALLSALKSFDASRGIPFERFAYRVIDNAMTDAIRRERREAKPGSSDEYVDECHADRGGSVEERVGDRELYMVAVASVDEDRRVAVIMRFEQDKGYRVIADEMGVAVNTAYLAVKDAIATMRKRAA